MMTRLFIIFSWCTLSLSVFAQTNITLTNAIAMDILMGDYSSSDYVSTTIIDDHDAIIQGINSQVSSDSLKSYILKLATFENRNTGSDTLSTFRGIGAARQWIMSKFQAISNENDQRLVTSFLQFDQDICGMTRHKNVLGILPGTDIDHHQVIVIEGHFDSRCAGRCDVDCIAQGIEDNASGTALVIELARVMSRYTFKNTIVFMATTGEEQGLNGAKAFADYAKTKAIPIEGVFNNDVIGGVICGKTSSEPSCPGLNDVDSLQVRLFSNGSTSIQKQLARFVKLQYQEELIPIVRVPMLLTIMSAEDRLGRGGDHIPFRNNGYAAIRFTSANEHGDASNGPDYTDRQHTHNDIVGKDVNGDLIIDSFYVDFNYLARNTVINGAAAAMLAIGPHAPAYETRDFEKRGFVVSIDDPMNYDNYRVTIRSKTNDWDTVYTIHSKIDTIFPNFNSLYFVSVASVDQNGIESVFGQENFLRMSGINNLNKNIYSPFELLQNKPNPFDESTIISVKSNTKTHTKNAIIRIQDMQGNRIKDIPFILSNQEITEIMYYHGYGVSGVYSYSLVIDDEVVDTKRMIFNN